MEISNFGEYYVWADNRIIDFLATITNNELIDREVIEKKNEQDGRSIRDLIEHISVYYEIVINSPNSREDFESKKEKVSKLSWGELIEYWKKWVQKFATALDNDTFPYPLLASTSPPPKTIMNDSIFTYSDHSTYHRGQLAILINIMTGQKTINTDYFTFWREKNKKEKIVSLLQLKVPNKSIEKWLNVDPSYISSLKNELYKENK